jgi:hypothetical protein
MALSFTTFLVGLAIAALIHFAWTFLTNLFFHPCAEFPGPIAASTGWYKCWQEVFRGRNWIDILRELHAKHGEIIRVGANEVRYFSTRKTFKFSLPDHHIATLLQSRSFQPDLQPLQPLG